MLPLSRSEDESSAGRWMRRREWTCRRCDQDIVEIATQEWATFDPEPDER